MEIKCVRAICGFEESVFDQPFCHACDNPFTVKHILVECSDFTHIRNKYYTTTDVHTLFREVDSINITECLKEIKLFDKI